MGLRSPSYPRPYWRYVKLPAGKILIPGVVSHATDLVEHPELVANRIIALAELVGQETSCRAPIEV